MELHLSGPDYLGMLTQQDLPPLETLGQYSSADIATVSELPTSTDEVLLRATKGWLIPELVDGDKVVFEVLGFTAAGEGEELVNVVIWTRPCLAPWEGDVLRPGRSSMSGLSPWQPALPPITEGDGYGTDKGGCQRSAMFDCEVLNLVQLAAE